MTTLVPRCSVCEKSIPSNTIAYCMWSHRSITVCPRQSQAHGVPGGPCEPVCKDCRPWSKANMADAQQDWYDPFADIDIGRRRA